MTNHIILVQKNFEKPENLPVSIETTNIEPCDFIIKAITSCNLLVRDYDNAALGVSIEGDDIAQLFVSELANFQNYVFYVSTTTNQIKEAIDIVNNYLRGQYSDKVDNFRKSNKLLDDGAFMEEDAFNTPYNIKRKTVYSWDILEAIKL